MSALLVLALALQAAPARAAQEVSVESGEAIPEMRGCVDYVGRGSFRSLGSEPINDPEDILGHSIYYSHFTRRADVLGKSRWPSIRFGRGGHSLRPLDFSDALIFTHRLDGKDQPFDWAWVWTDRNGKAFIPIMTRLDPGSRGIGWEPLAIRQFARPVSYRDPQPGWPDEPGLSADIYDDPDLFAIEGDVAKVRYGLYLSDLPALFIAARSEPCWR